MKNVLFNKKSLVAITLAAATLVSPLTANAQDFSNRRGNNDAGAQIAGGLIGGSVGAILGEEIAGRGNRTEGAVLGAIIGGVAGAAIGEGVADGNKTSVRSNRRFRQNRFNNGFNNRGFRNRGFGNRGFNTRFVNNRRGFNHNRGFGHNISASSYTQIDRIDYRLDVLKQDRRNICAELEYKGHDPYLKDRLAKVEYEIAELKERRRYLKRKIKTNRRFY